MGRAAPIHRAVAKVLQAAERPLTADEIFNQIVGPTLRSGRSV